MAALKTLLVLMVAALVLASVVAVYVPPCDQVCDRIQAERNECCRAHGYGGRASCLGNKWDMKMWCSN